MPRCGARPLRPELDLGLVVAGHGRHVIVETREGGRVRCHPRGKKSDAVVGDRVRWQRAGDEGVIEHVEPRASLLFRRDEWKTKSFAANIDQLLVLVAGVPTYSESQLARALIAAEAAGVAARIVLNKTDLPEAVLARERLAPYRALPVDVIETSLKTQSAAARERLEPVLERRATLLLGPSGSGKSTLVNLLVDGAAAQVGEVSRALGSGRHTTTVTQWYWLDLARTSALIDSPGFQSFGLRQVDPARLAQLMPDLAARAAGCRYYNCRHQGEPDCAVRAAIDDGTISASRYRIYLEILSELSRPRW